MASKPRSKSPAKDAGAVTAPAPAPQPETKPETTQGATVAFPGIVRVDH